MQQVSQAVDSIQSVPCDRCNSSVSSHLYLVATVAQEPGQEDLYANLISGVDRFGQPSAIPYMYAPTVISRNLDDAIKAAQYGMNTQLETSQRAHASALRAIQENDNVLDSIRLSRESNDDPLPSPDACPEFAYSLKMLAQREFGPSAVAEENLVIIRIPDTCSACCDQELVQQGINKFNVQLVSRLALTHASKILIDRYRVLDGEGGASGCACETGDCLQVLHNTREDRAKLKRALSCVLRTTATTLLGKFYCDDKTMNIPLDVSVGERSIISAIENDHRCLYVIVPRMSAKIYAGIASCIMDLQDHHFTLETKMISPPSTPRSWFM